MCGISRARTIKFRQRDLGINFPRLTRAPELELELLRDEARDFVLKGKDVVEFAIERLGPQVGFRPTIRSPMVASRCFCSLSRPSPVYSPPAARRRSTRWWRCDLSKPIVPN